MLLEVGVRPIGPALLAEGDRIGLIKVVLRRVGDHYLADLVLQVCISEVAWYQ